MLSDLLLNTPTLSDPAAALPEDEPLDFDGLLDIAREFEFTRTITHIWPSEEPALSPQAELDDILAAIVPASNTSGCLLPLTNPILGPAHCELAPSTPSEGNPTDDSHCQAEFTTLQGWSPPNGSHFLDLDDNLMGPQSTGDTWMPVWLTTFCASPYTQPADGASQSSASLPDMRTLHLQTSMSPITATVETANDPRPQSMLFTPPPKRPLLCVTLEPTRARPPLQTKLMASNQIATVAHANPPRPRPRPPSAVTHNATYAKAPRGGIPPHVARTVTKACVLRIEKERKVMRDAVPATATGERKKPSVLRKAAKVEKEAHKVDEGVEDNKKPFASNENNAKEGRATKRKRL